MPLFEFTCRRCGRQFEALIMGSRKAECPDCHSTDLEKLASAFGFGGGRSTGGSLGTSLPST